VLVAVGYELDGEILHHAPNSLLKLQACKPVYEEFGLWGQDANLSVSTFGELPRPAKRLIEFIEDETNVPVRYIGTGPARHQIIDRG
jgi:adenylosuccinate synthase